MKYRSGIDYQPITDVQIKAICDAHDDIDHDELRLELDDAAEQFIHAHYEQQQFTQHDELAKRLSKIENAAAKLLLSLDVDGSFELEAILNFGLGGARENKLSPLLEQVKLLKQVACNASTVQEKRKKESHDRSDGDQAFAELLITLQEIYIVHFKPNLGKAPENCPEWGAETIDESYAQSLNNVTPTFTVSTIDNGEVGGKFSTFVETSLAAIRHNLSGAVTESDPTIKGSLNKTSKAIRSKYGRLKPTQK